MNDFNNPEKLNHESGKSNLSQLAGSLPNSPFRTVPITILGRGEPLLFLYDGKENLMEAMLAQGIYFSASCGGRGTCGKCRVQVVEGYLEITTFDKLKLSVPELESGYRLSCKAYPREACAIRVIVGDEADFQIIAVDKQEKDWNDSLFQEDFGIAIDIGTTTLAVSLVGLASKKVIHTYTTINKQRAYGADVISRIKASVEGKKEALQKSIRKDLSAGIHSLLASTQVSTSRIKKLTIAGNTTMGHLLLGYPCESLGSYPFTPVNIGTIMLPYHEVLGTEDLETEDLETQVVILPGISAFVGGDIVAGLLTCGFDQMEKPTLLIDLGTNGEMAVGNKDRILVTSTAAGPAFEGGNISCGIGSIAGAICNVEIQGNVPISDTIGHKPPVGICGTGIIELASELLKAKLVDETGLLCERYFEHGYVVAKDAEGLEITFTQKDMRELQLAKAAIRAGIQILLRRYGITPEEIDTVYLAGGFGYQINLTKAIHIGLLPPEFSCKVKAIGNSALAGSIRYLTDTSANNRIVSIIESAAEISLSNDPDFNELYIENMDF